MNTIDNFSSMMGVSDSFRQSATALTDDQKKQAQTILAQYHPESLTGQDAQAIFKQFMDSGIRPGKDLHDAIKGAGFDPYELRTMALNTIQASQASAQSTTLTDGQKKQVQGILSQFDPNALTTADAQSIFKQLQKAGIQPSKDLKGTIQSAGYNTNELASLAAPQAGQRHPVEAGAQGTTHSNGINTDALQRLSTILNQFDLKNMSADQQKSLMTQLDQAGLLQAGETINISA